MLGEKATASAAVKKPSLDRKVSLLCKTSSIAGILQIKSSRNYIDSIIVAGVAVLEAIFS